MRVGEILHRDGLVAAEDLATALADQRIAGKRLCSLLVVRGIIEPDQAARALAEQYDCAAALTKHLDNRDVGLAKLLPANIARQHYALPIGRMRDGEIVICVRDPRPEMQAAFERILQKPVLITVAAAHTLEPLIDMTYAPVVTQDFGVRFARPSSQPANVPQPPAPQAFAAGTVRQPSPDAFADVAVDLSDGVVGEEFDVDLDSVPHQVPDEMPAEFSLVDLDDAGVDKDFSMHDMKTPTTLPPGAGAPVRAPTLPPLNTTHTPTKK
jgi:hypothetical protein